MPRWTEDARRRQAALIRTWSPWARATGPRTAHGRRHSSRNALRHGGYSREARLERALLRMESAMLRRVVTAIHRMNRQVAAWQAEMDRIFPGFMTPPQNLTPTPRRC